MINKNRCPIIIGTANWNAQKFEYCMNFIILYINIIIKLILQLTIKAILKTINKNFCQLIAGKINYT